jgi:hypothetical protein
MPRKKPAPVPVESPGKVRFEVRFDEDVYNKVKALADASQISVNQLMHALARWAGQNCKAGEPIRDEDGFVTERTKPQPGCIWAGEAGGYDFETAEQIVKSVEEFNLREDIRITPDEYVQCGMDKRKSAVHRGKVWLFFDFTERRVLRED